MANSPCTQIRTKSASISDLLKSAYFEIPPNQREYRWSKDQLDKLWDDLLQTIKNDSLDNDDRSIGHFLGAIVVIGEEQSLNEERWQVIDGQQRLTTITILAECLRPYVDEIDDRKIKRSLEHVLLSCTLSLGKEDVPRLRLNREDTFYRKSLIECETMDEKIAYWDKNFNPKSEVQVNIKYAFECFDGKIKEFLSNSNDEQRSDKIRDLIDTLTDSFYALLVRTESLWMAYRLFETLNERGLDLSQADLIRNVLLEDARVRGESIFDNVTSLWTKITDNYENQPSKKLELPQIVQFSYTYRHSLVKKEGIFDEISGDLRNDRHDAPELANEFSRDSLNWCNFLLGDLISWTDELADSQYAIVDPLWKLHSAPFIMASMDKYSSSINELGLCLSLCEHFLFRQGLVCRDSVSSLQEFFSEASALLRSGQDFSRLVELFVNKSPATNFIEKFKVFSIKNMKQGFYVLWKIEKFLVDDVGFRPKSQSAAQHLEHIMPRVPSSEWQNIEQEENFKVYLNRIGNLLILPRNINQHIKNKALNYKKANDSGLDYSQCELHLVKEFVKQSGSWENAGKWDFDSIIKRQNYLADTYASDVWSLNLSL